MQAKESRRGQDQHDRKQRAKARTFCAQAGGSKGPAEDGENRRPYEPTGRATKAGQTNQLFGVFPLEELVAWWRVRSDKIAFEFENLAYRPAEKPEALPTQIAKQIQRESGVKPGYIMYGA